MARKTPTTIPLTTPHLEPFDGRDVIATAIKITKAGDGLSTALQVEPRELHVGDEVCVVLQCTVGDITFKPVTDTDCLTRVHNLVTQMATFIDYDKVTKLLNEQRKKIDQARGTPQIDFPSEEDEA